MVVVVDIVVVVVVVVVYLVMWLCIVCFIDGLLLICQPIYIYIYIHILFVFSYAVFDVHGWSLHGHNNRHETTVCQSETPSCYCYGL